MIYYRSKELQSNKQVIFANGKEHTLVMVTTGSYVYRLKIDKMVSS